MNDKKIITEKELNYIETLYLYCNIEDFVSDSEDNHSTYNYWIMKKWIEDTMLHAAKHIGTAKGREWYKFDNYRIGIMEYDTAKAANQFNCIIQYEQHHMFTLDHDLSSLDLPFGTDRTKYHIKRIDITKIAQHDENYTKNYGYISPYKTQDIVNGTIYLGNRKNGNVFRMYDKTKELLTDTKDHPIDYKKIELLSSYFGSIENLYTYELELHRSQLKGTLGIETLFDLSKVYAANKNIVGKIRFYRDNDRNRRLLRNRNNDRVSCRRLTDFVEYKRIAKKKYKPSFEYAVKQMIKAADGYLDRSELDPTNENYMKMINAFMSDRIDQDHKDMIITFEDTQLSDGMDKMRTKHKLMRDNQSNDLELQAKWAFQRVV